MTATCVVVAGFPNTGTTITAMILGQNPAAFATGELADFPVKRHFADYNICSCGRKVIECDFWLGVRDAYAKGPRDDARLAELIADHSGRQFVVDVAHRIDRVAELVANPALDLRIIHMVRKRAAVLNSRLRRLYGRDIISTLSPMRVTKVVKLGRRHQAFLTKMASHMETVGERGIEVDYDQLCVDPQRWLHRIGSFLGLDYRTTAERMIGGQPLERVPHLLRGNGKLRTASSIVVQRDAGFQTELSMVDRCLYQAGAGLVRLGLAA